MSDSLSTVSDKLGMPPGALVHVGNVHEAVTRLFVVDYTSEYANEHSIQSIDELRQYRNSSSITWVIIEGLTDVGVVEDVGKMFDIHPLVLEDILNTHQRPKFEEYDDYLFIVLKCLMPEKGEFSVNYEQISLLVLRNVVLMFKEKTDDLFNPLLKQLRNSKGRLRSSGSDYLTYSVLDNIVDQGFLLIDALDETVILVESDVYDNPTPATLNQIQRLKREMINVRRNMSPVREMLAAMLRSESPLIHEQTYLYLRDVSDHSLRVIESVESYRDILSGLLEIYISSISNKMNEVMKVLTVFASIFIPLTFLAGIYGMNFEYMPELHWKWAYPALWVAFITIPAVLLVYFKKKKWL
ncbi:magnesium/cobalt transporter CorA [Neptunomonas qingdaonensis]|uniref:Magnesium transport protein CorA n=1 Tax=Neptunomonas qingdaonensis TaxID=1045558 RepID=A0A1I2QIC9_9GAMM|nr:magnesium/cobalt transporter CorA [Neptunomonas qingdaonensis]SFG25361.1 magnesium transporter [Neptunomonas qingdaonensis]